MKKKVVKPYLIIVAILLVCANAFGQDKTVQAFTLKEAIDYAQQFNVDAKNAKLDMKKAKAYNWEILTQGLPNLSGTFEYDHYFKVPLVPAFSEDFGSNSAFGQVFGRLAALDNGSVPGTTIGQILGSGGGFNNITFVLPNDITTGITLSQLLFDARYIFGIRARKELYLTSRLQSDLSAQDIKYNVSKAYYQAETAQEARSLLVDNQKVLSKLLSDTREVFKQGLNEETDVNRLELAEASLESQINQQNTLSEVALANLKYQMGLNLDATIILKDKLDDLKAGALPDASKFDPANRVEYQLLKTGIILKGYEMESKRSGYYPSIAGFLNYTGNVQTQEFSDMFKGSNWYPQGIVGLKVGIPIFDSGLKYAQVRQTKLEQMKLKNNFDNFSNAAKLQYQSALATYSSSAADEVIAQKTLDLSQKIYNRSEQKFKLGAGSSFELEQAEQEYTTNILKHTQSVMSLLNAKADLDKAMGIK